jgi:hypothetical protein
LIQSTPAIDALRQLIGELEGNPALYEPNRLRERIDALDRFDIFNLEMPSPTPDPTVAVMVRRAREIQTGLEAANSAVYEAIRCDIRSGRGAQSLLPWASDCTRGEGYDYLDELLAGVFRFADPGTIKVQPTPEMVFYQPTPARHIFDLFHRTALTERDVLIDLGSGLGHVPLLASICTRARSIGIEIEPAYIESARKTAELLNLSGVTFVQEDARRANLSGGTVFYLFTPFSGGMLREVLDSLRQEGTKRKIRVCTLGPCTMTVANEDWLEASSPLRQDRISIFRSRP